MSDKIKRIQQRAHYAFDRMHSDLLHDFADLAEEMGMVDEAVEELRETAGPDRRDYSAPIKTPGQQLFEHQPWTSDIAWNDLNETARQSWEARAQVATRFVTRDTPKG